MFQKLFSKGSSASKKTDHELFMEELFEPKTRKNNYASIHKYDSVNQYKSIHTYDKKKVKEDTVDNYTQPAGLEVVFNYSIVGIFYILMLVLLPFSLFVCLKRIKENERMVVYRLGRIISPEYKPGFCIVLPLIDSYKKLSTSQKEFSVPNLQILTWENAIVDTTTVVRYEVLDAIKLLNTLEDLNSTLKSVARGYLVSNISEKDTIKIEREKNYIMQDFQREMNAYIKKWGVQITNVDLCINSIQLDQNSDGEDPALKTISLVFKSLLGGGGGSDSTISGLPTTSNAAASANSDKPLNNLPDELMKFIEGLSKPMVIPANADLSGGMFPGMFPGMTPGSTQEATINMASETDSKQMSPYKILKLMEPLLNENLVQEIQAVYEFHIQSTSNPDSIEIFHLDLKTMKKGKIGPGTSPFSKTDCVIRLSDEDLNELLTDNLKPFTAYMSGRIEIDGDLQDVFKLKKLITSVSQVIASLSK